MPAFARLGPLLAGALCLALVLSACGSGEEPAAAACGRPAEGAAVAHLVAAGNATASPGPPAPAPVPSGPGTEVPRPVPTRDARELRTLDPASARLVARLHEADRGAGAAAERGGPHGEDGSHEAVRPAERAAEWPGTSGGGPGTSPPGPGAGAPSAAAVPPPAGVAAAQPPAAPCPPAAAGAPASGGSGS